MKHIAFIISGGNIIVRKGLINACLSRYDLLKNYNEFSIDLYDIQTRYVNINKVYFRNRSNEPSNITIDSNNVRVIWKNEYYSNIIVLKQALEAYNVLFHKRIADYVWLKRYVRLFRKYDILSVHSTEAAFLATLVKEKYGIPYCVTWHGSDIHTLPFIDTSIRVVTINAMRSAEWNFFVSKALMSKSEELCHLDNKKILYNGLGFEFYRFDQRRREDLRKEFGVADNSKVVAFAGTVREIKNVKLLPSIFSTILELYSGAVQFWVIGDGGQRMEVEDGVRQFNLPCVFWGNQTFDKMPSLLNCVDVLILPSKNEGLPLICLEAISCGANVVGSNVGGIPEAIGEDFCFDLNDSFVYNISNRIASLLEHPAIQIVRDCFDWRKTVDEEASIYNNIYR